MRLGWVSARMGKQAMMLTIKKLKLSESRFLHYGALAEHWEPMNYPHVPLQHKLKQKTLLTVSKQSLNSLHGKITDLAYHQSAQYSFTEGKEIHLKECTICILNVGVSVDVAEEQEEREGYEE